MAECEDFDHAAFTVGKVVACFLAYVWVCYPKFQLDGSSWSLGAPFSLCTADGESMKLVITNSNYTESDHMYGYSTFA